MDIGLYCPFCKPEKKKSIQYIICSNHPRSTIRSIVKVTSVRLSNLSNREIFKQYAYVYNNALRLTGFKNKVSFLEDSRFKTNLYSPSNPYAHDVSCTLTSDSKGVSSYGDYSNPGGSHFRKYRNGLGNDSYKNGHKNNNSGNRIHNVIWFAPLHFPYKFANSLNCSSKS